jgi:hypothetical protein
MIVAEHIQYTKQHDFYKIEPVPEEDDEAIPDRSVPSDTNSVHDFDFYYDAHNDDSYDEEEFYNCSMEETEVFYDCATEAEEIMMKQQDSENIPDQSVPSDLNSLHDLDFYYDANADDEEFYDCAAEEAETFFDCASEPEEIMTKQSATKKSRRHAQNWGAELMIYNNNKRSEEPLLDNEQLLPITPDDSSPALEIELSRRSQRSRRQAQNWGPELMEYYNNIASDVLSPTQEMEESRKSRRQAKNWGPELMQYNNNKTYDDSLCCSNISNEDENRDSMNQTSIDDEPIAPDVELDLVVEENFVPVVQEAEEEEVELPVPPVVSPPLPQLRRSQRLANAAASRQTLPLLPPVLRRSPRLALKPRVSYVGMC